ncbi:MAG: choice-of-anchor J domain-containing protein, partial [Lentimicrobiaceae bacterium]|nr:choice-of-anchor J domain-containing protein [Lentimicrobiaceae bacterium]
MNTTNFMREKLIAFFLTAMFSFVVGFSAMAQLTEGFESATAPPTGWSMSYAIASPPSSNLMTHSTDKFHSGARSFRFSSMASGSPYDQYLVTPMLLTTAGSQTVSFWYAAYNTSGEDFVVGWSSTGNNVNTDFTWGTPITCTSTSWSQFVKTDLPVGTKYIAIRYYSYYMYYLYVDDFIGPNVAPVPPLCATTPTPAIGATNIARNFTLSWADGGGATNYDVYMGTTTNPPFVQNVTSASYAPPVMAANTHYYWKVIAKNNYGQATGCAEW